MPEICVVNPDRDDSESMSFVIPSDMELVQEVLQRADEFARRHGVPDDSKTNIVLRELLANAIFHGNRNDRSLNVEGRIEHMGKQTMRIIVEDRGKGFDYSGLEIAIPDDPRHIQNRGYALISNLCKSLDFNERGNRVTAVVEERDGKHGLRNEPELHSLSKAGRVPGEDKGKGNGP